MSETPEEFLARFAEFLDRMAEKNVAFSEEEIERDIAEALAEVRRQPGVKPEQRHQGQQRP